MNPFVRRYCQELWINFQSQAAFLASSLNPVLCQNSALLK